MLGPPQACFTTLLSKHGAEDGEKEKSKANMELLRNSWGRRQWIWDLGECKGEKHLESILCSSAKMVYPGLDHSSSHSKSSLLRCPMHRSEPSPMPGPSQHTLILPCTSTAPASAHLESHISIIASGHLNPSNPSQGSGDTQGFGTHHYSNAGSVADLKQWAALRRNKNAAKRPYDAL